MYSKGLGDGKTINITSLPSGGFSQGKAHILPGAAISSCKTIFFPQLSRKLKLDFYELRNPLTVVIDNEFYLHNHQAL